MEGNFNDYKHSKMSKSKKRRVVNESNEWCIPVIQGYYGMF
jgi:hypothetical protein